MRLGTLLAGIATSERGDIVVSGLTQDSRAVRAGDAFVALAGAQHHGIEFAAAAVDAGAVVVLAERPGIENGESGIASAALMRPALDAESTTGNPVPGASQLSGAAVPIPDSRFPIPVAWIDNLRSHLGAIAARFYADPSAQLTVIGVTGTSGKTSTVQLLAQALTQLGHRAATIGTLGSGLHGALHAGERTTPDVIRVHGLLAEFRDAGATHVAVEVSSHALDQHRVDGVHFDVVVFTNLSRDHLDYHKTMAAYGAAKAKLFAWPNLRAVVINVDDAFGRTLVAGIPERTRILRCGIQSDDTDIRARDVHTHSDGIDFDLATPWGDARVRSRLLGRFNVANLLAVAGVLGALDVPFDQIHTSLEALQPVAGRMNRVGGGALPLIVVDYSHKPDALEQVLATLREHCDGRLTCVFGCGGERDAGKRPIMGAIAERLADAVIVTDDNPRCEDGDAIVTAIVAGMRHPQQAIVERDRGRAIGVAISQARTGDVILIAGKGHEAYQEAAGGKRPFEDLQVARATLGAPAC
ncbi:MAG: UDP-N-acetylmuramoyl-L-alanyl-D-glutamate--2,6-diaminopimelate ligase [Rhodanobacteraceae bacterium]